MKNKKLLNSKKDIKHIKENSDNTAILTLLTEIDQSTWLNISKGRSLQDIASNRVLKNRARKFIFGDKNNADSSIDRLNFLASSLNQDPHVVDNGLNTNLLPKISKERNAAGDKKRYVPKKQKLDLGINYDITLDEVKNNSAIVAVIRNYILDGINNNATLQDQEGEKQLTRDRRLQRLAWAYKNLNQASISPLTFPEDPKITNNDESIEPLYDEVPYHKGLIKKILDDDITWKDAISTKSTRNRLRSIVLQNKEKYIPLLARELNLTKRQINRALDLVDHVHIPQAQEEISTEDIPGYNDISSSHDDEFENEYYRYDDIAREEGFEYLPVDFKQYPNIPERLFGKETDLHFLKQYSNARNRLKRYINKVSDQKEKEQIIINIAKYYKISENKLLTLVNS